MASERGKGTSYARHDLGQQLLWISSLKETSASKQGQHWMLQRHTEFREQTKGGHPILLQSPHFQALAADGLISEHYIQCWQMQATDTNITAYPHANSSHLWSSLTYKIGISCSFASNLTFQCPRILPWLSASWSTSFGRVTLTTVNCLFFQALEAFSMFLSDFQLYNTP